MISGPPSERDLIPLTQAWGAWPDVSLYLDRCQVDTPQNIVAATWSHVHLLRKNIGKVIDFGAGDGRFSAFGEYGEYLGYEIDPDRCRGAKLPPHATLVNRCAFANEITDADVCIGNPPFVRNQDLPENWRYMAARALQRRTGVAVSGLANAWQYFFLLSLASLKRDGLCALVIPFEWVSRPASESLRNYIADNRWNVRVYRLRDAAFEAVLTTASITLIDKATTDGQWTYFEEGVDGKYTELVSPSGSVNGVIPYKKRSATQNEVPRAIRGLSPGTQKVLTLTEAERERCGLHIDVDVVPCVTSLRPLSMKVKELDAATFQKFYRSKAHKCWLIRTDAPPSPQLQAYLEAVPPAEYQTSTCLGRDEWWKFKMPSPPAVLMAQGFKGIFPKVEFALVARRPTRLIRGAKPVRGT